MQYSVVEADFVVVVFKEVLSIRSFEFFSYNPWYRHGSPPSGCRALTDRKQRRGPISAVGTYLATARVYIRAYIF